MLFGLGPVELSLISIALLLLFGDRLPKIVGSLAGAVVNLRNGLREVDVCSDIKKAIGETQKT